MKSCNRRLVSLAALASGVFAIAALVSAPTWQACAAGPEPMSYAEDVAPVFKGRCVSCHQPGGEGYEKSGLDLSTYAGLMKGTKFGPVVIPGNPETSNLIWLLEWRAAPELRMPHGKKQLSTCDRNAIYTWIRQGAKDN